MFGDRAARKWADAAGVEIVDCRHFLVAPRRWEALYEITWREGGKERNGILAVPGLLRRFF